MGNLSLNTGLKALLASRFVLDTVGHNLANANTPGYSRQRVSLASSLPLPARGALIGSGVDVAGIARKVDDLLARRINSQQGILGSLNARLTGLSEFESFFGAADASALSGLLDGFFTTVSDLATSPSDSILRTSMVQSSRTVTSRFNEINQRLAVAELDTIAEIKSRVNEVNARAAGIASLNLEIAETQSTGVAANDLLDRRDFLISELSELVDLTTVVGANGTVSILVAGNTLVGSARASTMSVIRDSNGLARIQIQGSQGFVPVTGGAVGGLLELGASDIPVLRRRFDDLAKQLILSTNRIHSTGVPPNGSFSILTGTNRLKDFDGDGKAVDELLSNAGLPFDVTSGALFVNVENSATGELEKHRIEISKTHTTVSDFLEALNSIPHLTSDIDASGRVRIVADSGYGFDFTKRLVPEPDVQGAFGGGHASLATGAAGPYGLVDGDSLTITVDPGGLPVTFSMSFAQADFAEISQATAEEIADVINADPKALTNGIRAVAVNDSLVLQSAGEGATTSFAVSGGTSVAALGWTGLVGSTVFGHNNSVDPKISGAYTGTTEGSFSFQPNMDGTIGTTVGLVIDVFDQKGDFVTSLNVGDGYAPGTQLLVADGVSVEFGLGDLSATHGDVFTLDLVPDSDTADILVALGLNGFFEGSSAGDIAVRQDIAFDPDLIASSVSGASGDTQALVALLEVKDAPQSELGGASIGQFYGEIIGELGFQAASTSDALIANGAVTESLLYRRDQISGVDVDEELVDLIAFEQSFQAAARFISVVSQLNDELLALI